MNYKQLLLKLCASFTILIGQSVTLNTYEINTSTFEESGIFIGKNAEIYIYTDKLDLLQLCTDSLNIAEGGVFFIQYPELLLDSECLSYEVPTGTGQIMTPVNIINSEVKQVQNGVNIIWTTAKELSNQGFFIERCEVFDDSIFTDWVEIATYLTNQALVSHGDKNDQNDYLYVDVSITMDSNYEYRIADVSNVGIVTYHDISTTLSVIELLGIPDEFTIKQAFPNPFNPVTTIRYGLPRSSDVRIVIFDITGRQIVNYVESEKAPGWHDFKWMGVDRFGVVNGTGIYIVRIQAGPLVKTQKITFLK